MTVNQFNYLVETYSNRLYRYILKQGLPQNDAEDIVQNSLEAVWKSKLEAETECGKYMFGVAYNQCADYWRKKNKMQIINTSSLENESINTNTNMVQNVLHQALLELPTDVRSLVLLKDYEGYSYSEIAEITNLNQTQVKVYLHRARLKLQTKLGNIKNILE